MYFHLDEVGIRLMFKGYVPLVDGFKNSSWLNYINIGKLAIFHPNVITAETTTELEYV